MARSLRGIRDRDFTFGGSRMATYRLREQGLKALWFPVTICALFMCSSCATMLKGTTDQIMISSDPAGADVSINDQQSGKTPFVTSVPSSQNLQIHLAKVGYQDQSLTDDATFRWGYEAWSFIVYVIPLGVDLADGAAWGHQQTMIAAHLEPIGEPAAATVPPAHPVVALSPAAPSQGYR